MGFRGDYFRFGLIFIKKNNQTEFYFFKKSKPVQTDRFRFGSVWFFRTKTGLARFFSVWVRFGFFSFRLIKPKQNLTGRFFQNFNHFFFTVWFFQLFFFLFNWFFCSSLIGLKKKKRNNRPRYMSYPKPAGGFVLCWFSFDFFHLYLFFFLIFSFNILFVLIWLYYFFYFCVV